MIHRHPLLRHAGGIVLLTGLIYGCSSAPPPVAETPPPVSVSPPIVREIVDYDDYEGRIAAVDTWRCGPAFADI